MAIVDLGFFRGANCKDVRGKDIVWPILSKKNNSIKMKELGQREGASLSTLPSLDLLMTQADLEFPLGCANSQKYYNFANFLPKTLWKWKNLDPGGCVPGAPSLDPPVGSPAITNEILIWWKMSSDHKRNNDYSILFYFIFEYLLNLPFRVFKRNKLNRLKWKI